MNGNNIIMQEEKEHTRDTKCSKL